MPPKRRPTWPLHHVSRHKPRRWPLVLRMTKGAVHTSILFPVVLHALFTALIVFLDQRVVGSLGIPGTLVPSLSIVVGLMLVFRNQTGYDRFWTGRNCFTQVSSGVRNLTRALLCTTSKPGEDYRKESESIKADTEKTIRVLIALLYAVKNSLREEWSTAPTPAHTRVSSPRASIFRDGPAANGANSTHAEGSVGNLGGLDDSEATLRPEYLAFLPQSLPPLEQLGLPLPLQLLTLVESHIRRLLARNFVAPPNASYLQAQVAAITDAYARMETIRTTPIPVAHLIHARQVLALYTCVLPFAMVDGMGWWSIPVVVLVAFTLYGIEGIGSQLEDPFGYDRNDIKMDAIVEDARVECLVLLEEWVTGGDMFLSI